MKSKLNHLFTMRLTAYSLTRGSTDAWKLCIAQQ